MEIIPQIFTAKVMHKRIFPKENSFTYSVYYLALPLPAPNISGILASFDRKDLGYRDGSDPRIFVNKILSEYMITEKINDIMLITMPKVLGYVFNPVSFYLCLDRENQLRAVIAEVHNTFGEQHCYFCAHADYKPILKDDWLEAEKVFHVSPFLERNGHYRFRFMLHENRLGIWIDYFDKDNQKKLITSLTGHLSPLDKLSLYKAFWCHPLVTLKTITLIHWQALKLVSKQIRYISKPKQFIKKISTTNNLNKM